MPIFLRQIHFFLTNSVKYHFIRFSTQDKILQKGGKPMCWVALFVNDKHLFLLLFYECSATKFLLVCRVKVKGALLCL